ncbi:uncharacterized membrane protein YhaH (DUF805 family) [Flavobacterium sp. CG_9.1]|uniref:DUF805 domain-containing protein n=1 Tax=Flavobacterium sp. CG_9.1 TaxID=2787728 RepID=UPI0018C97BFC|nr:DUF805 domain-containing protein [Flavobacterium sp. CG_9.1]MBG6062686.1 uncharacterized membrane protein YhaH (DUF805 family) [Flavobacterium sp. CG_9.1]
MFTRIFSLDGRIRRLEYGISLILFYIIYTVILLLSKEFRLLSVLIIPLFWLLLAQGAKRCHDMGNNGWWQIIPLYGLWMLFDEGQNYSNDYGVNPKAQTKLQNATASPEVKETVIRRVVHDNFLVVDNTTTLEVRNVNYSNLQEVLRQLRSLNFVKSLNYEILDSTASITVKHDDTSQYLLDEFIKIADGINVLEVTQGNIIIKIK